MPGVGRTGMQKNTMELGAEPLVDPREHDPDAIQDIELAGTIATQNAEKQVKRGIALWVVFIVLIVFVVAGAGAREYAKAYIADVKEVDESTALLLVQANTSASKCHDVWGLACGTYAESSIEFSSVYADAEKRAQRQVWNDGLANSGHGWGAFLRQCRVAPAAPAASSLFAAGWLAARALQFGPFRLARETDLRLATYPLYVRWVASVEPCAPPEVVPGLLACIGELTEFVATAAGATDADAFQVCVPVDAGASLCNAITVEWPLPVPGTARGQTWMQWCFDETIRLWPVASSRSWVAHHAKPAPHGDTIEDASRWLARHASKAQKERLAHIAIVDRLPKGAEDETYITNIMSGDFWDGWSGLHYEQAVHQFGRRNRSPSEWPLHATSMAALYDPVYNTLFVAPAYMAFLGMGGGMIALARVTVAMSLALSPIVPIPNVTVACVQKTYGLSPMAAADAAAARRALAGVANSVGSSITNVRRLCNPSCTELTEAERGYVAVAQLFCVTGAGSTGLIRNRASLMKHMMRDPVASRALGCGSTASSVCAAR